MLSCGATVSHASYHRASKSLVFSGSWTDSSLRKCQHELPVCCGEMGIIQWESLCMHMDAAELGCCLHCLSRQQFFTSVSMPASCASSTVLLCRYLGTRVGLCPFLPTCLNWSLDKCSPSSASSPPCPPTKHKHPRGQPCLLTTLGMWSPLPQRDLSRAEERSVQKSSLWGVSSGAIQERGLSASGPPGKG